VEDVGDERSETSEVDDGRTLAPDLLPLFHEKRKLEEREDNEWSDPVDILWSIVMACR
jgi:hypothetical protein